MPVGGALHAPDQAVYLRLDPPPLYRTRHDSLFATPRIQPLLQTFPKFLIQSAADTPYVAKRAVLIAGEDQAAKLAAVVIEVADDDAGYRLLAFDLDPGVGALAGQIAAVEPLGDDAFQ